jgi:DNA-binding protein HU-beta
MAKTATILKAPISKTAAKAPAAPTVTLKNIGTDLAALHEMSKKQMNTILDDLVASLVKNLKKGNRIRMAGLGILQVRKRAARMGRNPATGETIKIPAKKKIAFRAAKELKEAVGK